MQQKRRNLFVSLPFLLVVVVTAVVALMLVDVPAPSHEVEQELDAQAFITQSAAR